MPQKRETQGAEDSLVIDLSRREPVSSRFGCIVVLKGRTEAEEASQK